MAGPAVGLASKINVLERKMFDEDRQIHQALRDLYITIAQEIAMIAKVQQGQNFVNLVSSLDRFKDDLEALARCPIFNHPSDKSKQEKARLMEFIAKVDDYKKQVAGRISGKGAIFENKQQARDYFIDSMQAYFNSTIGKAIQDEDVMILKLMGQINL